MEKQGKWEEENALLRFYTVSIAHPAASVTWGNKKNEMDELTQPQLESLQYIGHPMSLKHGIHNGHTFTVNPMEVGRILKAIPDPKTKAMLLLSYNYGNAKGLQATKKIKEKQKTDVSLLHIHKFDDKTLTHDFKLHTVAYVKKGRRPGTHILYGCDRDSQYINTAALSYSPTANELIREAMLLSGITGTENPKTITKNQTAQYIKQSDVTDYIKLIRSGNKVPDKTKMSTTQDPVQNTTPTKAATDKMDVDDKKEPASTELTQKDYEEAAKRVEEIQKIIQEKGDDVDPALVTELAKNLLIEKYGLAGKVSSLTAENTALNGKLNEAQKEQTDEWTDFLSKLAQTPGGKESFEASGITEEKIKDFGSTIKTVADPKLIAQLNEFMPAIAAACNKQARRVQQLGGELDTAIGSIRKRNMRDLTSLIEKKPIVQIARQGAGVPPPQSRFNGLPTNTSEYEGKSAKIAPAEKEEKETLPNKSLSDMLINFSRYSQMGASE